MPEMQLPPSPCRGCNAVACDPDFSRFCITLKEWHGQCREIAREHRRPVLNAPVVELVNPCTKECLARLKCDSDTYFMCDDYRQYNNAVKKKQADEAAARKVQLPEELAKAIRTFVCRVNAVTSYHRHGLEPSERKLTALANGQIEFEEVLRKYTEV